MGHHTFEMEPSLQILEGWESKGQVVSRSVHLLARLGIRLGIRLCLREEYRVKLCTAT